MFWCDWFRTLYIFEFVIRNETPTEEGCPKYERTEMYNMKLTDDEAVQMRDAFFHATLNGKSLTFAGHRECVRIRLDENESFRRIIFREA